MNPAPPVASLKEKILNKMKFMEWRYRKQREETSLEVSSDAQAVLKSGFLGVPATGGAG